MSSSVYELEQGLPASMDAERAILGAILLDNEAYYEAGSILNADYFSLDSHRRIFSVIRDMVERNTDVDIITLSEEMRRTQQLEAIGGAAYMASLTDGVPPRASVKHYCEIVVEKGHLRGFINACNAAISQAMTGERAGDVANGLEDAVLSFQAAAQSKSMVHIGDFIGEAVLKLEQEAKSDKPYGLSFGLPSIDDATA